MKELLVAVDEDQKSIVEFIDTMEERLESLMKGHKLLLKEFSQLNVCSMDMSEVVKKVIKEEVEKLERKTGQLNTDWSGAGVSWRRRTAVARHQSVLRTVSGFSLARRLGKQVEDLVDFTSWRWTMTTKSGRNEREVRREGPRCFEIFNPSKSIQLINLYPVIYNNSSVVNVFQI